MSISQQTSFNSDLSTAKQLCPQNFTVPGDEQAFADPKALNVLGEGFGDRDENVWTLPIVPPASPPSPGEYRGLSYNGVLGRAKSSDKREGVGLL